MCRKFVSERNGRPKYLIGEEGDAEANRFLELCGGRAGQAINPPIPPPPQARDINTKIYKCATRVHAHHSLLTPPSQLQGPVGRR